MVPQNDYSFLSKIEFHFVHVRSFVRSFVVLTLRGDRNNNARFVEWFGAERMCNVLGALYGCEYKFYTLGRLKGAGKIVIYSMGNFFFPTQASDWYFIILLLFNWKSSSCLHSCSIYFSSSWIRSDFSARINIA